MSADALRAALEACNLTKELKQYAERGRRISDEHDKPHPDYSRISKLEEQNTALGEDILGDILTICGWAAT